MRKSHFGWAVVLIVIVAWAGWHLAGLLIAGIGLFVAYFASLRVHPRTRHTGWRGCNGTGEHRGAFFGWGHRRCPGCTSGRTIRTGAGYLGAQNIRSEYRRSREARATARTEHRWR